MSFYNSIAAKQIGRSHVKNKLPCQDSCKATTLNDVTVAVVSDGCGSAQHSEYGSQLIVDVLSEKVLAEFDRLFQADAESVKSEINAFVLERATALATENKWEVRDLKATYLVVAVKGSKWLTCRLGDGAIVLLHRDKSHTLNVEAKDEAVEFTTYFTSSGALKQISLQRYDDESIVGAALMTDGAMDCLIDSNGNLNKLLHWALSINKNNGRKLVREKVQELVDDIASHDGENPIDDDCSLALISAAQIDVEEFVKKFVNAVALQHMKVATELIANIDDTTLDYLKNIKYSADGADSKKIIAFAADVAKGFSGCETVEYFKEKYGLKGQYFKVVSDICDEAQLLCVADGKITLKEFHE